MKKLGVILVARPQKPRKISGVPCYTHFAPLDVHNVHDIVEMTICEYETIKLIDGGCFTQEQCADKMKVGRTTVQATYKNARKKLANCIINGCTLVITGV